jgi:hypothetical protein
MIPRAHQVLERTAPRDPDEARAGLAKFADEIQGCAPGTKVVVPDHFQPISI